MVEIIRKGPLPQPEEVPEALREAAVEALRMTLREPRPVGFPLLFTSDMKLIEPAVAYLHEHAIQRAHTPDTARTYMEILYDWFDALEQSGIAWTEVDAVDLVAYRNRMLERPSPHTGRPYSVRTINHRVRGILRFTAWAVRNKWLPASPRWSAAKTSSNSPAEPGLIATNMATTLTGVFLSFVSLRTCPGRSRPRKHGIFWRSSRHPTI